MPWHILLVFYNWRCQDVRVQVIQIILCRLLSASDQQGRSNHPSYACMLAWTSGRMKLKGNKVFMFMWWSGARVSAYSPPPMSVILMCMNNQRTTSPLKIGLYRCYTKSPTAQDACSPGQLLQRQRAPLWHTENINHERLCLLDVRFEISMIFSSLLTSLGEG